MQVSTYDIYEWINVPLKQNRILQMSTEPRRLTGTAVNHQNRQPVIDKCPRKSTSYRACTHDQDVKILDLTWSSGHTITSI